MNKAPYCTHLWDVTSPDERHLPMVSKQVVADLPAGAVVGVNRGGLQPEDFYSAARMSLIEEVHYLIGKRPDCVFLTVMNQRAYPLEKCASMIMWPDNLWLGAQLSDAEDDLALHMLNQMPAKHKWMQALPLVGSLHRVSRQMIHGDIEWVVAGAPVSPIGTPLRYFDEKWAVELKDICSGAEIPFSWVQNAGRSPFYLSILKGKFYTGAPKEIGAMLDRFKLSSANLSQGSLF